MKVRFEEGALADLGDIFTYVAADNPKAAAELVEHIEHAVMLIGQQPAMGRRTKRPDLKQLAVEKYLIVYEIASEEIIIQYVRHGARKRKWEEG